MESQNSVDEYKLWWKRSIYTTVSIGGGIGLANLLIWFIRTL